MKGRGRNEWISWFVAVVLLFMAGCGYLPSAKEEPGSLPNVGKIAVLPMDRASVRPGQEAPTCILTDKVVDAEEIAPEVADRATGKLFSLLQGDSRFALIPKGQCMGFLQTLIATDVRASQIRMLQAFGRENGADAVLYGQLLRFRERVGGNYAAKSPASVAFTLTLIRVRDGAIIWSKAFDETQEALSDNLFKLSFYRKTGMKWATADELLSYGLEQAVEELRRRLP